MDPLEYVEKQFAHALGAPSRVRHHGQPERRAPGTAA